MNLELSGYANIKAIEQSILKNGSNKDIMLYYILVCFQSDVLLIQHTFA